MIILRCRLGWLRQKEIYTNADRPYDDDQQFHGYGHGGVRGDVRERVVRPRAELLMVVLAPAGAAVELADVVTVLATAAGVAVHAVVTVGGTAVAGDVRQPYDDDSCRRRRRRRYKCRVVVCCEVS